MKDALFGILGIVLGLGIDSIWEKNKLIGYNKPAFSIFGYTLGEDDVLIVGIGFVLMLIRPLRWTGVGVIAAMAWNKYNGK